MTRNGLLAIAACTAFAGPCCAQEPRGTGMQFTELRRWRWQSPDVVCGGADAAGTIAALGRRDAGGSGWEVLLWDAKTRTELRVVPVSKRPIAMRFPDGVHVEVRLPDTDAFFSLSRWHRFRIADGAAAGEPQLSRVDDDDPVARRLMRAPSPLVGNDAKPGPDPSIVRETRAVSWWQDDATVPIADLTVYATELTPDGRFVVVWLPTRLVAIPVGGGDARVLPVAVDTIRAIDAGANGDELVVVTADAVRVLRVAAAREMRSVPFAAEGAIDAALAPGGGLLGLAFAGNEKLGRGGGVVLLDLESGRSKHADVKASAIAWTSDGRRLACAGSPFTSVDRDGKVIGESTYAAHAGATTENYQNYFSMVAGRDARAHIAALDGDVDAWSLYGRTKCVTLGKPIDDAMGVPFVVHAQLSPGEVVATDGMRLRICDLKSWESIADFDLRAEAGKVGVARGPRRVAVVVGPEVVVLDVPPAK